MQNDKKMTESREHYEAPKCEIIEMQTEGVLLSGSDFEASHEGFEDGDVVEW